MAFERATTADFKAIHAIWMQAHVLPFLGFEDTPYEAFIPILEETMASSEVYVLKEKDTIVAVGRLIYKTGARAHTVELGSFAVHVEHLRKGHADLFFQHIIQYIQTNHPQIIKLEMGQTSDNEPAHQMATRIGFQPECIFPERPRRKTGDIEYTRKWHVAARYMARMLTNTPINRTANHVQLFEPKVPLLCIRSIPNLVIQQEGKRATFYLNGQEIAQLTMTQWNRRFEHIQYWEMSLASAEHKEAIQAGLRQLLLNASLQCKKIEIFAHQQENAEVLRDLGFYCRGNKKNAYQINNAFYDEIGADFSFFTIKHAAEIVKLYLEKDRTPCVLLALIRCKSAIIVARSQERIDSFGALYLENLAFQLIRETYGEPAMRRYGQAGQAAPPWEALIGTLPEGIKESFMKLGNAACDSRKEDESPRKDMASSRKTQPVN